MSARKGEFWRAVGPDGTTSQWRRRVGTALKDAAEAYLASKYGPIRGVRVVVDVSVAVRLTDELKAAGWMVQKGRAA